MYQKLMDCSIFFIYASASIINSHQVAAAHSK